MQDQAELKTGQQIVVTTNDGIKLLCKITETSNLQQVCKQCDLHDKMIDCCRISLQDLAICTKRMNPNQNFKVIHRCQQNEKG